MPPRVLFSTVAMRYVMHFKFWIRLAGIVCFLAILAGCAGSPEATAQWYLNDKPADMRVPVSGQSDPADAAIAPLEQ